MLRMLEKHVAQEISELFHSQEEGWHARVLELKPGLLVGLTPALKHCKICGAPTRESLVGEFGRVV